MDWEVYRPSRATSVCLVLLFFSFLLMTFRLTSKVQAFRAFLYYWVSPSQETAMTAIQLAGSLRLRIARLVEAHHENRILREKVKQLSLMELQYQDTLSENQRLKLLLNLKSSMQYNLVPAMVSGRDTQNWTSAFWIDKGSKDGVLSDSPVLSAQVDIEDGSQTVGGVVGRIIECGLNSSKVLLISDSLSSIAVSLPRTQEQGLVQGQDSFSVAVKYLDPAADTQIGDEVVTSGLGEVFPSGLRVGKLSKVFTTPSGFKSAELKPAIALNKVRDVFILIQTH